MAGVPQMQEQFAAASSGLRLAIFGQHERYVVEIGLRERRLVAAANFFDELGVDLLSHIEGSGESLRSRRGFLGAIPDSLTCVQSLHSPSNDAALTVSRNRCAASKPLFSVDSFG
jgi:hypothetical protein